MSSSSLFWTWTAWFARSSEAWAFSRSVLRSFVSVSICERISLIVWFATFKAFDDA